jgi:hypothetical protein
VKRALPIFKCCPSWGVGHREARVAHHEVLAIVKPGAAHREVSAIVRQMLPIVKRALAIAKPGAAHLQALAIVKQVLLIVGHCPP